MIGGGRNLRVCAMATVVLLAACGGAVQGRHPSPTDRPSRPGGALDRVWVAPGPKNPQAIAADRAGVVAVGRYGPIVALDGAGRQVWSSDVAAPGEQTLGPLDLGSQLIVTVVNPDRLLALRRSDGGVQWSASIQEPIRIAVGESGALVAVAAITATGVLQVFDGRSGAARWSAQLPFGEDAGPISVHLRAGHVVAAWAGWDGGRLQVFDLATGVEQWSEYTRMYTGTPAVTEDAVFVSENLDGKGRTARIVRFDLETGDLVWSHQLAGPFLPLTAIAVDRQVAMVVSVPGIATGLDVDDGSERWQRRTHRPQEFVSPEVVGDAFAMTTYGTGLVVLSRFDGSTVLNDAPGPVQLRVTFEGAAAAGAHLYLLAGRSRGGGEIWMLAAS